MYVWAFLGVGSVRSFDNALKLIGICQHDFVNNRKNVKRIKWARVSKVTRISSWGPFPFKNRELYVTKRFRTSLTA